MNTKEVIRDFLSCELLHGRAKTTIGDDDQLIDSGIIDSLGIVTLLSFLEETFSLQVPGEDLVPENFASISSISALVEHRANKERQL